MKKPELRPLPGQEPKRIKSDPTVFDRCNVTRRGKLFDEEPLSTVEERQPYTLKRRNRRHRPFLSPAGEVVLRLRGGRGFTPIYAPWSPAGLARVRGTGRAMAMSKADEYRATARECEERAERTRDPFIQQQLTDIAEKWRTMADHLEKYSR